MQVLRGPQGGSRHGAEDPVDPGILPLERKQLDVWTRKLAGIEHFIVEIKGDSLIVHTPGDDIEVEAREWASEGYRKKPGDDSGEAGEEGELLGHVLFRVESQRRPAM